MSAKDTRELLSAMKIEATRLRFYERELSMMWRKSQQESENDKKTDVLFEGFCALISKRRRYEDCVIRLGGLLLLNGGTA